MLFTESNPSGIKAALEITGICGAHVRLPLMPATAKWLGVKNSWDPGQNIWGSALYLKKLYDHYCDWRLTLAAYNAGPKKVSACGCVPDIPETQIYVRKVIRFWDSIEADSLTECLEE